MNTEVVLLTNRGAITHERTIGYINEPPMVVAAHLFNRYFISVIDETELFPMTSVNFVCSLKLNAHPFEVADTIDISSLANGYEDKSHPIYKANICNEYFSNNSVKEYNSILSTIIAGEEQWVTPDQHMMIKEISSASKVGFTYLLPQYKALIYSRENVIPLQEYLLYPITLLEKYNIPLDSLVKDTLFSSLNYLKNIFKSYIKNEEKGA